MTSDSSSIYLKVFRVRGQPVVLDRDLAALYEVDTKVFNQTIRRNIGRFPSDFAFQLSNEEFANLRSQIVTSSLHGGRRYAPLVFTEHGAIMAATILNSSRAVAMSVYVVRAFMRMRDEMLANATLSSRLDRIEKALMTHDSALRDLYQKIKLMLLPPENIPEIIKSKIGFHHGNR